MIAYRTDPSPDCKFPDEQGMCWIWSGFIPIDFGDYVIVEEADTLYLWNFADTAGKKGWSYYICSKCHQHLSTPDIYEAEEIDFAPVV